MSNYFKNEIQKYLRDSMDKFGDFNLPSIKSELTDYIVPTRMKQEDNSYTVQIMVPGYSKEELKVTIQDDMLVVTGEHDKDESYEDNKFFTERFEKKVALNNDINYQEVAVELKNGVLNIHLPKKETQDKNEFTFEIKD